MHKTTKINIAIEAAGVLFLVAVTVISIIKGLWFYMACNIFWTGVEVRLLVQTVCNDKTFRENEDLRNENERLVRKNSILKCENEKIKSMLEGKDEGEKTIRWYKDRFAELAEQMERHHGAAKEIRISSCYHSKQVEIDF